MDTVCLVGMYLTKSTESYHLTTGFQVLIIERRTLTEIFFREFERYVRFVKSDSEEKRLLGIVRMIFEELQSSVGVLDIRQCGLGLALHVHGA